jgi:hypothetical protein
MNKKHKKNQWIRYVEIRTNRNKWTKVEFIRFKSKGMALFRLQSGEFITRTATKKIRWGLYRKYGDKREKK